MTKKNYNIIFLSKIIIHEWKNKLIIFLLAFSISISSFSSTIHPVLAYSNILLNGDMENWASPSGPAPDSWTRSYGDINAARSTAYVKSGTYSAAVTGSSGSIVQDITSVSYVSDSFTYGMWVLDNVAGSIYFRLRARNSVGTYFGYAISASSSDSANWQFMSITQAGCSGTITEFNVDFYCTASGSSIYMDKFHMSDTASFPFPTPSLDSPPDISYEQGDPTTRTITWIPTDGDNNPTTYSITNNSVEVRSDSWTSGSPISIDVHGLSQGTYVYELTIFDGDGLTDSDTVVVTVTPPTPPVISQIDDVTIPFGISGYWLNWTLTDSLPSNYIIYQDEGVVDANTFASGETIPWNIDGLALGKYNFTMEAFDDYGARSTETTMVTVVPDERIFINGNSELADEAIARNWDGDGSSNNPYLINNSWVNWIGSGPAISINNTTDYFIMSNVTGNSHDTGFYFYNVLNGQIVNSYATNNEVGMIFEDCQFFVAEENIVVSSTIDGIRVIHSQDCTINDNNVTTSTLTGIYIENSLRTEVNNNNITFSGSSGIYINSLSEPTIYTDNIIHQNTLNNNTIGLYMGQLTNTDVSDNQMCNNSLYAIYMEGVNSSIITGNIFESNDNYGLSIDSNSHYNQIYYNSFIDNLAGSQANDNGSSNIWYYNSVGNLWSDYSGVGTYSIDGTSGSEDLFPVNFININGPADFSREQGQSVNIVWTTIVSHPGNEPVSYTVYQNGSQIRYGSVATGNWSNTIPISIFGLLNAIYYFDLTVINSRGMSETDTVKVTVGPDLIAPTISSPDDISFEEGSLGFIITWSGSDGHPWNAEVLFDGLTIYNESWIGEDVIINLEALDLTAGSYTFICTFSDFNGNTASDTVIVTVNPLMPDSTNPIINPPVHLEYVRGTIGHNLTFITDEAHPKSYEWSINGTFMGTYVWRGENIVLIVDHLNVGYWTISVTVFDLSGNNASAIGTIQVISIPIDYIKPTISQPAPLEIYENQPGSIIWDVFDDYPDRYIIYRNGIIIRIGSWTNGIIQYSFTSLSTGTHEFNLTVWDLTGNWQSRITTVTVNPGTGTESIDPIIASIPDKTITFGTTGNLLIFKVFDEHPNTLEILMNGTRIYYSLWINPNQQVTISLDSLLIGSYEFKIIAEDLFANKAELSVIVNVIGDNSPPTLSSPESIVTTTSSLGSISISWTVSDDNLDNYKIIIVETDEVLLSGTFEDVTTDTVNFPLSGLEEGEYTIRIVVYDKYGNYAMDDVFVKIGMAQSSPGFEIVAIIQIILLFTVFRLQTKKKGSKKEN